MRFELLGAAEQFGSAGAALVDAFGGGVGVFADARALGTGLTQNRVLLGCQLLPPLRVGELDGRSGIVVCC
jgi:hypothetical protein